MNNFDKALQAQILSDSRTPYSLAMQLIEEQEKTKALQERLDSIISPEKADTAKA